MEDFIAYPSRWRLALLILGAAVFVALGLWLAGHFGSLPEAGRYPRIVLFAVGWVTIIFFGVCGVIAFGKLFDSREQLRIGAAGIRSAPWSDQTIPWSEIVDVWTWSYRRQRAIILSLRDPARFPGHGLAALLAGANRMLTGGDVSITLSGTDRSFDEAMSAIARFRPTGSASSI